MPRCATRAGVPRSSFNQAIKYRDNVSWVCDTLWMKNDDARTLPTAAQEQLRTQAIRLRKQGETDSKIGEILGIHKHTAWKWWKKYQTEGAKGLKVQPRGRCIGAQRRLAISQELRIQRLITDHTSDQLKLTFAL